MPKCRQLVLVACLTHSTSTVCTAPLMPQDILISFCFQPLLIFENRSAGACYLFELSQSLKHFRPRLELPLVLTSTAMEPRLNMPACAP